MTRPSIQRISIKFNVITGERYKMVTKEFKGLVRGEYGRTPVPIDPAFRKKILGDEAPIECRPADLIPPELAHRRSAAGRCRLDFPYGRPVSDKKLQEIKTGTAVCGVCFLARMVEK